MHPLPDISHEYFPIYLARAGWKGATDPEHTFGTHAQTYAHT